MKRLQDSLLLYLFAFAFVLGAGCGQSTIANPSGTCGTRSDSGRAGYQAPGNDTWVPDCQNSLRREYWRVFTQDGTKAYVLPRPDGASELQPICSNPQNDLRGVVDQYGLCMAAASSDQVAIVNHIDLSDALRITHFLHTQLTFVASADGLGIEPFPIPSDIVDACTFGGRVNSNELEAICQRERDRIHSGSLVGFTYTGTGAAELVARLNELYGVP